MTVVTLVAVPPADDVPVGALVHVMIPAFGDDAYLRAAIESVLAQDSDLWLLTISDDGPTDPVLAQWITDLGDDRVTYLHNPVRLGINRNFQRCLELARGAWVVLVGADDRLHPRYVRVVSAAAAAHPDVAWIQPSVRVIGPDGSAVVTRADQVKARLMPKPSPDGVTVLAGEELARSLLVGNWMYFPAVAFRRDVVLAYGFQVGRDIVLDLDLYLRMLVDGASAAYLDEVAVDYRRHAASLSSTEAVSGVRFAEERAFFDEAAAALDHIGWHRAARAARLHVTSRLYAVLCLPRARSAGAVGSLLRHAAGH